MEGERDAAPAEAAEEVADEVELEEAVQEGAGEEEGGEGVVRRRHQRRRAEQQLGGRIAGGRVSHRVGGRRDGTELDANLRIAIASDGQTREPVSSVKKWALGGAHLARGIPIGVQTGGRPARTRFGRRSP